MLWQFKPAAGGGGGVTDHGALTGLADDDHPHYHNDTRGDVRYNTKAEITSLLSGKANASHTHVAANITDFNAAALVAAPAETLTTAGALINSGTSKTTPVDADYIGLMDSAASNVLKKLSWANVKATLKTYFDTLYAAASHSITGHSGFPGGTSTFLRADGTFSAPPGGGSGTDLSYVASTRTLESSTGADVALPLSSATTAGLQAAPENSPARFYYFQDFISSSDGTPFVAQQSGTGAGTTAGVMQDASPGWLNINLGTTATGRAAVSFQNGLALGSGPADYKFRFHQNTLSDAITTYVTRIGILDSVTGNPVDGVFFRYTHSVNSGRWEAVTRANNVETAVDTGITATISTKYVFSIVVNSAGTSAEFRINGAVVATITTNIPTGTARETGAGVAIVRSVGTAAITPIVADYQSIDLRSTVSRT